MSKSHRVARSVAHARKFLAHSDRALTAKHHGPASPALPMLPLGIYVDGRLSRVESVPDPREALAREYDKQGREFGLTAAPLLPTTLYEVRSQGEPLFLCSSEVEAERYASTFNEGLTPAEQTAIVVRRSAIIAPIGQTGGVA